MRSRIRIRAVVAASAIAVVGAVPPAAAQVAPRTTTAPTERAAVGKPPLATLGAAVTAEDLDDVRKLLLTAQDTVVVTVPESAELVGVSQPALDGLAAVADADDGRLAVVVEPGDGQAGDDEAGSAASVLAGLADGVTSVGGAGVPSDGGVPWLPIGLGAIVVLAGTAYVVGARSKPAPAGGRASRAVTVPTGPAREDRPGPRRRPAVRSGQGMLRVSGAARVRSDFHPDGYVEIDSCLVRARWADAHVEAPGYDEWVRVQPQGDRLLAFAASGPVEGQPQRRQRPRTTRGEVTR